MRRSRACRAIGERMRTSSSKQSVASSSPMALRSDASMSWVAETLHGGEVSADGTRGSESRRLRMVEVIRRPSHSRGGRLWSIGRESAARSVIGTPGDSLLVREYLLENSTTVRRLGLSIVRHGEGYQVAVNPPHCAAWGSTEPLTATKVLEKLASLGYHSTDITDALYAADPGWAGKHDGEVLRRRKSSDSDQE